MIRAERAAGRVMQREEETGFEMALGADVSWRLVHKGPTCPPLASMLSVLRGPLTHRHQGGKTPGSIPAPHWQLLSNSCKILFVAILNTNPFSKALELFSSKT